MARPIRLRRILFASGLRPAQVPERDAGPPHLVAVGRADAAAGRPDRAIAPRRFTRPIQRRMIGKNDVGSIGDLDPADIDPDAREHIELGAQAFEAHDRPAADEQRRAIVEHSARDDPQRQLPLADDERMPRVIAAAEARDEIVIAREVIDDAAFAFIAPLDPQDQICGPPSAGRRSFQVNHASFFCAA